MDSIKSQLQDMGFHEAKVKRALESCPEAQTLEQVMEWLIAHEDELNSEVETKPSNKKKGAVAKSDDVVIVDKTGEPVAEQEPSEASQLATKKKITVEEAQKLINERQVKRAEEERIQAIENEKRRRVDGQKLAEVREEMQNQERIRLAELSRREKLEKQQHRQQVLDQIARDREAMKNKNNPKQSVSNCSAGSSSSQTTCSLKGQPTATECKIALRFPDGSSLVHKFSPKEQLSAVRLFVQMEKNITNEIEFIAPPNKKFSIEMMDQTLENLGLCPASRLEVRYNNDVIDLD